MVSGIPCFTEITRGLHALAVSSDASRLPQKFHTPVETADAASDSISCDSDVITALDRLKAWYSHCVLCVWLERMQSANSSPKSTPTKHVTPPCARSPSTSDVTTLARNILCARVVERRHVDRCLQCIKTAVSELIARNAGGDVTPDRRHLETAESVELYRKASGDFLPMDGTRRERLLHASRRLYDDSNSVTSRSSDVTNLDETQLITDIDTTQSDVSRQDDQQERQSLTQRIATRGDVTQLQSVFGDEWREWSVMPLSEKYRDPRVDLRVLAAEQRRLDVVRSSFDASVQVSTSAVLSSRLASIRRNCVTSWCFALLAER